MIEPIRLGVQRLGADLMAGTTLAMTMIPEAMTLAFAAGLAPLTGLYSAALMLLVISLLGGRPAMAAMSTPALVLIMADLAVTHGLRYLFASVIMMGLLQLGAWVLRLGKFIRILPQPVVLGCICGLTVEIFWQQMGYFHTPTTASGTWMTGTTLVSMLSICLVTMLLIRFLPRYVPYLSPGFIAIVVLSWICIGFHIDVQTLAEVTAWSGAPPHLQWPSLPLDMPTLAIVMPYALLMAIVGLSETLFTLNVTDEATNTRGRSNQECLAQGIANLASGCLGGMPGSGHFGQSMVNLQNGGRSRLSTLVAVALIIYFSTSGRQWMDDIPVGVVVGIMLMIAFSTFELAFIRIVRKVPRREQMVTLLVAVTTLTTNLSLGMLVGVILSALGFAWEHAKHVRVFAHLEGDTRVYVLHGPLFFGSAQSFQGLFQPGSDPDRVVIDFRFSRVYDHSGLEAIEQLVERYSQAGKTLLLRHLSTKCRALLNAKAQGLVEINLIEDPQYQIASDLN
ncbi:hypothetical protein WH50_02670 [Pokkaliibacter plantistimulans]|uniref:STAS domain-containing protein n=1 Tax=Pokkaliibacter plantistimulans TaxID=1635171 RepID=A0ABX5M580_9GAMM|nr:SulP family inorganic anion transporter [Pokkaliibacter plantistimulans]PXF32796.1 hypothetical protein WH50_02670 [Pokkaliibacter plantistimulans]